MADPNPEGGWMSLYPEAAAIVAGVLAALIRATTAEGRRPWRAVFADGLGTIAIGWLAFHMALGAGAGPNLAFGISGLVGALGWEWVRRTILPKIITKMGG
jgi:hypothetical protein